METPRPPSSDAVRGTLPEEPMQCEAPRPPSDAVRRTPPEEPMQCEYSRTRMETSNGARELLKEDEPYDEEAMAKDLVAATVKYLEIQLKSLHGPSLHSITQGLITCVSNYYTREEMKTYMTSMTPLTAADSELFFDSIFANNEMGRKAYLERSLRMETCRGRKALNVQPQQQFHVSQKQQVPVSSQVCSASCNHDETSTSHVCEQDCRR